MRKYVLSFSDSILHAPVNGDRTAKRTAGWDVMYQEWPNRKAMAKSIRMQQLRETRQGDWKPCVPLTDGEGY